MSLRCPQCSKSHAVAEGDPLRPWCPRCGADLQADDRVQKVTPTAESLEHGIQLVRQSQEAKQQERWQIRRAGLGAFLAGLAFLAVGAFVIWFNAWWEGRAVVPVRLLLVLLLPLAVSLAGLYSFLTGEKTLAIDDKIQDQLKSHTTE